jgi:hypothetical protein
MRKSGLADSPFFTTNTPGLIPGEKEMPFQNVSRHPGLRKKVGKSKHANQQESMPASIDASMQADIINSSIESIRKAVKFAGKEPASYRFTHEEKKALLELAFSYKVQGFRTSENEIIRIAVNFLLKDIEVNGQKSVAVKVLQALNR